MATVTYRMARRGWQGVARALTLCKSSKTLQIGGVGAAVLSTGYMLLDLEEKRALRSLIGSSIRFARSLSIGLIISADYLLAPTVGDEDKLIHKRSAQRIFEGCLLNGGLYIKLGQGLAALNHILPREYVETLTLLQDKCLTREPDEVDSVFLEEFGSKPKDVFKEFNEEPIAAASLAQRILTTEWIDGCKINDTACLKEQGLDLSDVDRKLFSVMAEQIFHTGFIHADPHPGNILVRRGSDGKAQLVLLDHGLYEILPEKVRHTLCNFWESIVLRKYNKMKKYAQELNVDDHILLAEMITQAPMFVPGITSMPSGMTLDSYMQQQAKERFDKVVIALRAMPSNLMLVIRNLNTIRAIAREHGDPINRYRALARLAVSGKHRTNNRTLWKKLAGTTSYVWFETRLWTQSIRLWFINIYIKILQVVGYDVQKAINQATY
ncbi:uncharacterized aarF domain-containing protein kinase 5 isoform X3 [Athalia rosae]|uniref:uncharacterized aarF domain-containing protein kinase 5 isoform X3 n=1 Tax=Athalia rosae TaxID=37344 RepID=UPI0020334E6F|nr:uncharacterized aarF domain-containing protein kinase 5 isoform X3 [Athalia rosae]